MFAEATTNLPPTLILAIGSQLRLRSSRSPSDLAQSTVTLASSSPKQQHLAYYPAILTREAMRDRFYAFATECECPTAYLIQTEHDGAHCKAAGAAEAISELHEAVPGEEIAIEDEHGSFWCKRLMEPSDPTQRGKMSP
jgi:hypothetical protein